MKIQKQNKNTCLSPISYSLLIYGIIKEISEKFNYLVFIYAGNIILKTA